MDWPASVRHNDQQSTNASGRVPPQCGIPPVTERSLFLDLLEMDDPAQRSVFLEQACTGSPELRSQVEQLLSAHDEAGKFMERPAKDLVGVEGQERQVNEGPGTIIGPYKLLEQIGEGGFGVVFM